MSTRSWQRTSGCREDAENVGLLESLLEAGFEARFVGGDLTQKGMRFNTWLDLLGSVSDDFYTKC